MKTLQRLEAAQLKSSQAALALVEAARELQGSACTAVRLFSWNMNLLLP